MNSDGARGFTHVPIIPLHLPRPQPIPFRFGPYRFYRWTTIRAILTYGDNAILGGDFASLAVSFSPALFWRCSALFTRLPAVQTADDDLHRPDNEPPAIVDWC